MELTTVQIFIVGFAASVLVQAYKLLRAKYSELKISKAHLTVASYLVALVLGVAFNWAKVQEIVTAGDISLVVESFVNYATVVIGGATVIYNLILDKVLEKVGFGVERYLPETVG